MFIIIRKIISKKRLIIAAVILLPLIFLFNKNNQPIHSDVLSRSESNSLIGFVKNLNQRWIQGDLEGDIPKGKLKCSSFKSLPKDTPSEFYECNAQYLRCFLQEKFEHPRFKFRRLLDHAQAVQLSFEDKELNQNLNLNLQKHCHEKFLPSNIYMASEVVSDEYKWDNFQYNIFVDKYYAANIAGKPLIGLAAEKMHQYCHIQGKVLLPEFAFDAASFYPQNGKEFYQHPYPWDRNHRSFLNDSQSELGAENCLNAYVKGCEKFLKFHNFLPLAVSWMGINHTLGSLPEYVAASFEPRANLKLSSFYLEAKSWWHRLGRRAYWDGDQVEAVDQYRQKSPENVEAIKGVSFRCARIK